MDLRRKLLKGKTHLIYNGLQMLGGGSKVKGDPQVSSLSSCMKNGAVP
jgi:hypothetical protein